VARDIAGDKKATLGDILKKHPCLASAAVGAPGGEASGGVHTSAASMIVVDLAGEEFEDALCCLRRGVKNGAGWRSGEGARMISMVISHSG
jgi:hypothetical protein